MPVRACVQKRVRVHTCTPAGTPIHAHLPAHPTTHAPLTAQVREGFDPIDESSTGRVIEGSGSAGLSLRQRGTTVSLTAGNIAYRTGQDDPLAQAQASAGEGSVPSLKATLAQEYRPDCIASASYDLLQRKPELALAWAGSTARERASVLVHADPLFRTYKLAASVAFPGEGVGG